jgi:hypothetical protein
MTKKHDDAKKLRDDLVEERAALVAAMKDETPNSAAWLAARDEVIRKSSDVRAQGNIMRGETGREMGEGTSYTGPLQDATKTRIAELAAQEGLLGLNPISDWQQANINLFEDLDPNLSYGAQRTEWDRLWGADRGGMLEKQRAEYGDITKKDDDVNGKDRFDVNDDWFSNNDNWSWDGSQWVKSGTTSKELETPAGSVDMLAYRTGTNPYWKRYLGDDIRKGLMKFKLPDTYQTSLGYLPGEIRAPQQWAQYLGMGGLGTKGRSPDKQFQGAIPQGTWRTNIASYPGLGAAGKRQPGWQFAAAPTQMVNMPAWTPYNIDTTTAGDWKGLLGDWAAPTLNTTNLLGVA